MNLRLVHPEPALSPEFYRSLAEVRRRVQRRQRWQYIRDRFGMLAFFALVSAGLACWFTLAPALLAYVSLGLITGLVLVTLLKLLEEA